LEEPLVGGPDVLHVHPDHELVHGGELGQHVPPPPGVLSTPDRTNTARSPRSTTCSSTNARDRYVFRNSLFVAKKNTTRAASRSRQSRRALSPSRSFLNPPGERHGSLEVCPGPEHVGGAGRAAVGGGAAVGAGREGTGCTGEPGGGHWTG